jgi:hypothetical protein
VLLEVGGLERGHALVDGGGGVGRLLRDTDDSQVDVVPAGRGSDAEAVDRAVAWLKARKKRPWMPWDDDPDDTSDEEDDDTNE